MTDPSLVAHVALAPQFQFELLEGMQQQNTSWTRRQIVCIVFKETVQLFNNLIYSKKAESTNRF